MVHIVLVRLLRRHWSRVVARLPLQEWDEGTLLMARDLGLPIPELDAALSRIKQARAATTSFRYPGLQMHKHLGAPAQ